MSHLAAGARGSRHQLVQWVNRHSGQGRRAAGWVALEETMLWRRHVNGQLGLTQHQLHHALAGTHRLREAHEEAGEERERGGDLNGQDEVLRQQACEGKPARISTFAVSLNTFRGLMATIRRWFGGCITEGCVPSCTAAANVST